MSLDPQTIQQMLMQRLQQGPATATAGGGGGGPQMQSQTSPMNAAATLAQKAMLIRALQNQQQKQAQGQFTANQPAVSAQMANDPAMQALQQPPQMDANLLAQMQATPPVIPSAAGAGS
jgi:hypothetical protein